MKQSSFFKRVAGCALALLCCISVKAQTTAPGDLLDKSAFETEINGKPVSLFTITNGRITAQVTNYGGYIVGIYTPDKDGNYTNVVGHNDSIQQYQSFSRNPAGASLGRYANRIGNATFTLDGTTYNLTKNNGENCIHGGRNGFDHTVWDVEEVNERSVVLSCILEDGADGFPGNLKTFLTFSITDDDGVSIGFKATTDKPTVCNLSHHVYFNLDGFPAESYLNHIVWINADAITEVDNTLLPTGKLLPVQGTPFDFGRPAAIGDRQVSSPAGRGEPGAPAPVIPEGKVRVFDHNFCLNHTVDGAVEKVASVYSPASGRYMEVFNDQPGLQFYTGNRLAFAMESQLYPDTPNRPEFPGNAVLRPGETYHHTIIYKFSKSETQTFTPTEAIRLSDPFIFADKASHMYYMTGTGGMLWKSSDLKTWEGPFQVTHTDPDSWMGPRPMIWAAEIHQYNGRYYYFGTFTNRNEIIQTYRGNVINRRACHILVGDSPEGPFYPMQDKTYLPADQPTLDATLWVEEGKPYLIFCHEWLQNWNGTVESIPLKPDLSGTYPEGRKLLFRAFDSPWSKEKDENGNEVPNKVTDGPFVFRTGSGRLGMIWTSWVYNDYTQGVAYSQSGTLAGPWIQEEKPITPPNYGHGMIFTTFDGKRVLCCHSHRPSDSLRIPAFFLVDDSGDKLKVLGRYYP